MGNRVDVSGYEDHEDVSDGCSSIASMTASGSG